MFQVKIFRPDKNGDLALKKTLSAKKCSEIHWDGRQGDPLRTGMKGNTGVKYHRIGKSVKCIEPSCLNMVDDCRKKICSPSCQQKRLARQHRASREKIKKKRRPEVECKVCKFLFKAMRSDHIFCGRKCRNTAHNKKR